MRQTGGRSLGATSTKIQIGLTGLGQRLVRVQDSQQCTIGRHHSDWRNADLLVDPLLRAFDCYHPFLLNNEIRLETPRSARHPVLARR